MTTPKTGDAAEARTVLQRPVHAEVTDGSRRLGSWRIALIPDAAPQVEVDGDIAPTPTGAFAVPWRASDDYGVVGIDAAFRRVAEEAKPGQPAAAADSPFLAEAPGFAHRAAENESREARGRAFQDLTSPSLGRPPGRHDFDRPRPRLDSVALAPVAPACRSASSASRLPVPWWSSARC